MSCHLLRYMDSGWAHHGILDPNCNTLKNTPRIWSPRAHTGHLEPDHVGEYLPGMHNHMHAVHTTPWPPSHTSNLKHKGCQRACLVFGKPACGRLFLNEPGVSCLCTYLGSLVIWCLSCKCKAGLRPAFFLMSHVSYACLLVWGSFVISCLSCSWNISLRWCSRLLFNVYIYIYIYIYIL